MGDDFRFVNGFDTLLEMKTDELYETLSSMKLHIFDESGNECFLYESEYEFSRQAFMFNLGELPAGYYTYSVEHRLLLDKTSGKITVFKKDS